jgi:hypothetical protein
VWHEVLGLRFARKNDSVELTWHPPAGARQILVERWPCGLDERPAQPALLCPQASGRLIDDNPLSAKATYRVWCIYDGPEGDFVTLGTMITVAPRSSAEDGASGGSESAPQDISAAAESQYREIVDTAPVATHDAEPKEANPLKRMGLWPPVRSK